MAATLPKAGTGTYTFASQPRAVAPQRSSKYREPSAAEAAQSLTYGNMMYDSRIVRGNTYRLQSMPTATTQIDPLELQMLQEQKRKTLAKKRAEEKLRVRTPDAVSGRQHTEVQTELYLEELTDRIEETDVDTQTDAFLDRPASPLFIPAKSGLDAATQIENGELFDFDIEVRPILEVLIGKTVEQAMMEVMEAEELARLRQHQQEFEELRNTELVETQRREEAARRAREEKDRRVRQARDALAKEKETSEKVAARAFAKNYVASLVPGVFASLSTAGYFYDQQEREIENEFIPWLLDNVDARLLQYARARSVLDAVIESVVKHRLQAYAAFDPVPPPVSEPAPTPSPAPAEDAAPAAASETPAAVSDEPSATSAAANESEAPPPADAGAEAGAEAPAAVPVEAAEAPAEGDAPAAPETSVDVPAANEASGDVPAPAPDAPATAHEADPAASGVDGPAAAEEASPASGADSGASAEAPAPPTDEAGAE